MHLFLEPQAVSVAAMIVHNFKNATLANFCSRRKQNFGVLVHFKKNTHDSTTFTVCKINVFQTAQYLTSLIIAASKVLTKNSLLLFPVSEL